MSNEEEVSAAAMEEEPNPSEVIESETTPPRDPQMLQDAPLIEEDTQLEGFQDGEENRENEPAADEEDEEQGNLDFGDDDESDDDEVVVTIGDIKTNIPPPRRGFTVQKLDPNVTPNVQGKNIFEVNPTEYDDRPWLKSGANIADYFNFGFNEETWNEYAEKQRLLRLEFPSQAEVNRVIMEELREKHAGKDVSVPIIMPVHNVGGRNLVTIQSIDTSKPPVKIGFPTGNNVTINTNAAENLPPMIRNLVTNVAPTSQPSVPPLPPVNLATASNGMSTETKPIVVDLTKPPPNFSLPPPNFNAKPSADSPNPDVKPDLPPGTNPSTASTTPLNFNPNVPPPNFPIRLPPTNLTNFGRPPMSYQQPQQRSSMGYGNFNNPMGMMLMNGPPPSIMRQHSNEGPPGIGGGSRVLLDGPPGTEVDTYRSDRRERDRDTRRRDSDGSDDDRRRSSRYDRRDRDRDSRPSRRRSRSRSPRERTHRDRGRDRDRDDDRKRRSSRERDRDRSRRHHDDDRDRRSSRRDKDRSDSRGKSTNADLDEGPPGV